MRVLCAFNGKMVAGVKTGDALGGLGQVLTQVFHETIEAFRDITLELPSARTPQDAADIVLRDDRKLYVGVALLALAALAVLVSAR